MTASKGFVVPAGGGTQFAMGAPGRMGALKLACDQTGQSIMMFEETVPPGTKSWFHLHHDSDEVAWVLEGEMSFRIGELVSQGGPGTCAFFPRDVPHAWKNCGTTTARVLFLYTPGSAGRYVEDMVEHAGKPRSEAERDKALAEHRWEVLGPNPL